MGCKAKFDNLTANLAGAKQQQTQAQVSLNYTQIKAPISGVVVERLAEPGDTATPGIPLLTLYNPKQLQLAFNVREQQAVKLKLGDRLNVSLPSLDHKIESAQTILTISTQSPKSTVSKPAEMPYAMRERPVSLKGSEAP